MVKHLMIGSTDANSERRRRGWTSLLAMSYEQSVRKNIQKVIEAFVQGRAAKGDSKGSCSTDGMSIYSYRMEIARRNPDGSVWVMERGPTATTNAQIRAIEQELAPLIPCRVHEDCLRYPELGWECKRRCLKKPWPYTTS